MRPIHILSPLPSWFILVNFKLPALKFNASVWCFCCCCCCFFASGACFAAEQHTKSYRQLITPRQRLTEFCQEYALVIANTLFQQHKRRLYTWTSPDGQYQHQIDYILCSQRWRSSIQSAKTRPGADCGSDHELLIAKFRLKLKKVGKTPRPFRYDRSDK